MHTDHLTHSISRTILEQGRRWFHFARALDADLRAEGSRLWVKPKLHARYGLRQTQKLRARTFILTTRLEEGSEDALLAVLEEGFRPTDELDVRHAKGTALRLATRTGHELGTLNRPAWSWIAPLAQARYVPTFYLHEVAVHEGALKAHVVVAHFHEGVEAYLMGQLPAEGGGRAGLDADAERAPVTRTSPGAGALFLLQPDADRRERTWLDQRLEPFLNPHRGLRGVRQATRRLDVGKVVRLRSG